VVSDSPVAAARVAPTHKAVSETLASLGSRRKALQQDREVREVEDSAAARAGEDSAAGPGEEDLRGEEEAGALLRSAGALSSVGLRGSKR
jgi:hypothetical protein